MKMTAKIEEIIEVYNHETNEKSFLLLKNNEWININEQEYNKILEGEKNDKI